MIDVITTDSALCRSLPKMAWLIIVLLLPDINSLAGLVAGRVWNDAQAGGPGGLPDKGNTGRATPSTRSAPASRPGYAAAGNPDDDEEFLARVRRRADEQRRRARDEDGNAFGSNPVGQ